MANGTNPQIERKIRQAIAGINVLIKRHEKYMRRKYGRGGSPVLTYLLKARKDLELGLPVLDRLGTGRSTVPAWLLSARAWVRMTYPMLGGEFLGYAKKIQSTLHDVAQMYNRKDLR